MDYIVTRLRQAYKDADDVASVFLANEAANEIERLVNQLRIQAEVVNGKDYQTISGGLHLDAADEIERLRAENRKLKLIVADIAYAVIDKGKNPAYHKKQVVYVRRNWATLWNAVSRAVEAVKA